MTDIVTTELKSDGWYYTNTGYRFHAKSVNGMFSEVWDLESLEEIV